MRARMKVGFILFLIGLALLASSCGLKRPILPLTIESISPALGAIGSVITITGYGFTPNKNSVQFGLLYINNLDSVDGKKIQFHIPEFFDNCNPDGSTCWELAVKISPGIYPVRVINANGISNSVWFEVVAMSNRPPVIESISPTSGTIGAEITIRGSGFTPENNDIAFTHEKINFQGRGTAYLNGVPSPDGNTLRFTLPDVLGACAFSQMKPGEVCPAVGIGLPIGRITISVVNRNGISNGVVFERTKSEIEIAEEIIYNSPAYRKLSRILDEIVRRTGGSVGVGIRKCDGKICIIVWIEKDIPELSRKIPAQIEGYEVRVEKGGQ